MPAITDINELLTHMQPILNPGRYAFVALLFGIALDLIHIVAYVWEPAGLSVILLEQIALDLGLPVAFPAAWITLTIHPDLAAVGPTAAFSQALGQAGISCNVVGAHHDHLLLPAELAQQAMGAWDAL